MNYSPVVYRAAYDKLKKSVLTSKEHEGFTEKEIAAISAAIAYAIEKNRAINPACDN